MRSRRINFGYDRMQLFGNHAWRVPKQRGKVFNLQTKALDAAGNIGSSSVVRVTSN